MSIRMESIICSAYSFGSSRSEEHTSELQSRLHLVCRLLLEKKKYATARRRSVAAPSDQSGEWWVSGSIPGAGRSGLAGCTLPAWKGLAGRSLEAADVRGHSHYARGSTLHPCSSRPTPPNCTPPTTRSSPPQPAPTTPAQSPPTTLSNLHDRGPLNPRALFFFNKPAPPQDFLSSPTRRFSP